MTVRPGRDTGRVIVRYADLAARLLALPPRLGPVRLVGVDGPTGSGKSTFADRLAAALGEHATVLRTDDLLDGWEDTVTFWPRLERCVLAPLRSGRPGTYHPYDWHAGRFSTEPVTVPVADVLVLDGVTSTRREARHALTLAVWLEVPFGRSLARAVERDGEAARPELEAWRRRESAHFTVDDTAGRADLVVDGAPTRPHDPATEFVAVRARRSPGGG